MKKIQRMKNHYTKQREERNNMLKMKRVLCIRMWKCANCNTWNSGNNKKCSKCGRGK